MFSLDLGAEFELVSPLVGECVAIREGLNFVASLGLKVDLVETDAVNAITSIAKQQFQGIHGPVVSDICNFLASTNSKCCWIPRDGNEAAHSVAKFGLVSKKSVVWSQECPLWLSKTVCYDIAGLC